MISYLYWKSIEKTTRAKQHGWSWMCILVEVTWTCNPSLKWTWKSSLLPFHGWPEMITAKAGHCCVDVFGPWYNLCLMWQAGVKRGKRWCSIKTCRCHWEQSYTVCLGYVPRFGRDGRLCFTNLVFFLATEAVSQLKPRVITKYNIC